MSAFKFENGAIVVDTKSGFSGKVIARIDRAESDRAYEVEQVDQREGLTPYSEWIAESQLNSVP